MPLKKTTKNPLGSWEYELLLNQIQIHATHLSDIKADVKEIKATLLDSEKGISGRVKVLEETKGHISEIKTILLNPDSGLTGRIKVLEIARQNSQKLFWIVVTSVIGLALSGSVWMFFLK